MTKHEISEILEEIAEQQRLANMIAILALPEGEKQEIARTGFKFHLAVNYIAENLIETYTEEEAENESGYWKNP